MANFLTTLQMPKAREMLLAVVLVMLFIVVFLFAAVVIHKLYVEFGAVRYQRLRERYLSAMGRRLSGRGEEVKKPRKGFEYEIWGDVIAEMMANSVGETVEFLKLEARGLGLDAHFRKMARSRSWTRRFIAMERLGLLRLPEMRDLYLSILPAEKDPHIISKTVWALSLIADESVLPAINGVLKDPSFMSSKYAEFVYTNIIASFRDQRREDAFIRFMEGIKSDGEIPLILKRDIIAACGVTQFYPAKEIVREYYHHFHDSSEMRIACLRALERLSDSDASPLIGEGLNDGDWRVRAVAARSARVCGEELLALLSRALRDKNYYVRMNAALSLAGLGAHGVEALMEATRADDRFAADVSRYVLKR